MMNWNILQEETQLEEIREKSRERAQVIFKHSTRCGISSVAKNRLDKSAPPEGIDFYYLDLIRYRGLSTKVSELFQVHHESPQVLVIRQGECVYDESHLSISMEDIAQQASF